MCDVRGNICGPRGSKGYAMVLGPGPRMFLSVVGSVSCATIAFAQIPIGNSSADETEEHAPRQVSPGTWRADKKPRPPLRKAISKVGSNLNLAEQGIQRNAGAGQASCLRKSLAQSAPVPSLRLRLARRPLMPRVRRKKTQLNRILPT